MARPQTFLASRAVLESHGFLGASAREALGAEIGPAHLRTDLPLYLRAPGGARSPSTSSSSSSLAPPMDGRGDAAAAVAPVSIAELEATGLLERGPRGVRARVGLSVHRDLVLAHDTPDPEQAPSSSPTTSSGTNAPAVTLDCLTVRRAGTTLDLGVGGGVQSLPAPRATATA